MTDKSQPRRPAFWGRMRQRLLPERLSALPGWAARWLYWNGQLYRLAGPLRRLAPAGLGAREGIQRRWRRHFPPPVCEHVGQWCQRRGYGPVDVIHTPQARSWSLPRTIEPQVHAWFTDRQSFTAQEKYLAVVPRARLMGSDGLLVLPDGRYALELTYDHLGHLQADPAYSGHPPRETVHKRGDYYSLMLLWAREGSYYHWIHDVVLRLYRIQDKLPADIQYIVPSGLRPYQLESLRIAGIPSDRLVPYSGRRVWDLERLYFSPPTCRTGYDLPEANLWFRDLAWAQYGLRPARPSRRLFISRRAGSRGRKITNEAEVEACLQRQGFETVLLENLSFGEQVALFSEAAVVVGSHGAGFTNMLFSAPGLEIIDIFEPQYVQHCFWTMSEALGHHYSYFFGETVPCPGTLADIQVPLEKLLAALALVGLSEAD